MEKDVGEKGEKTEILFGSEFFLEKFLNTEERRMYCDKFLPNAYCNIIYSNAISYRLSFISFLHTFIYRRNSATKFPSLLDIRGSFDRRFFRNFAKREPSGGVRPRGDFLRVERRAAQPSRNDYTSLDATRRVEKGEAPRRKDTLSLGTKKRNGRSPAR